jgi:hypothetical protein
MGIKESLIALTVESASSSERSANFYQTTRCNNPEDSHLHSGCPLPLSPHLDAESPAGVEGWVFSSQLICLPFVAYMTAFHPLTMY